MLDSVDGLSTKLSDYASEEGAPLLQPAQHANRVWKEVEKGASRALEAPPPFPSARGCSRLLVRDRQSAENCVVPSIVGRASGLETRVEGETEKIRLVQNVDRVPTSYRKTSSRPYLQLFCVSFSVGHFFERKETYFLRLQPHWP